MGKLGLTKDTEQFVTVRCSKEFLKELQEYIKVRSKTLGFTMNRSDAIRALVRYGLDHQDWRK